MSKCRNCGSNIQGKTSSYCNAAGVTRTFVKESCGECGWIPPYIRKILQGKTWPFYEMKNDIRKLSNDNGQCE